jgi:hypothetical protein
MNTVPMVLTAEERKEIAQLAELREMWGAESAEEFANMLGSTIYAVKFDFISGGPGYCGDYFILQGEAIGNHPPLEINTGPGRKADAPLVLSCHT